MAPSISAASPRRNTIHTRWIDGPLLSAPAAGVVLSDTGPLAAGSYMLTYVVGQNTEATVELVFVQRDAANLATLHSQLIEIPFAQLQFSLPYCLDVQDQERFQMVNRNALAAGEVQVSIFLAHVQLSG